MQVEMLNDENYGKLIANPDKTVVIDFFASWCGPCKMYAPTVERFAQNAPPDVAVYKCDVDQSGSIAERFFVMSVPTTVIMRDGSEIRRITGAISEGELSSAIDSADIR